MKRLLCIVTEMGPGGAETFLMKLYRKLDKANYQMDFCVSVEKKGYYDDEIIKSGGHIFHITPKSKSIKSFKEELNKVISDNNYQNVLKITSNAMGFLDLKVAKKAGAKLCIARSSNSSDGGDIKSIIAHKIGKFCFEKYIDVRIAPSDLAGRYTFGDKTFEKGEVYILKNGIDLDIYSFNPESRKHIRNEMGLSQNQFVIGHIGRFVEQKNHKFVIRVFKYIKERIPNSVLLLVGTGPLKKEIYEETKKLGLDTYIRLIGTRSDIPDILSALDVFFLPSLYEGMPNVLIEAQANGLNCVVSNTITKESNISGYVHYLSLDEDIRVWGDAIIKLRNIQRHNNRERIVQQGYDIEEVLKTFIYLAFK